MSRDIKGTKIIWDLKTGIPDKISKINNAFSLRTLREYTSIYDDEIECYTDITDDSNQLAIFNYFNDSYKII
jgi:hypothetical protein